MPTGQNGVIVLLLPFFNHFVVLVSVIHGSLVIVDSSQTLD